MGSKRCAGSLVLLGCCAACPAAASHPGVDDFSFIQRDAQLQGDPPEVGLQGRAGVPPTKLAQQRRQRVIIQIRDEMDKYLSEKAIAESFNQELPPGLPTLDAAAMMDTMPALMDSLRDDDFIRNFIEFEDNVEQAGGRFVRLAHTHLRNLLRTTNATLAMSEAHHRASSTEDTQALRMSIATFLDRWVQQVLTSYPEELAVHAEHFAQKVGNEHQLSKGFSDLFVPIFKNMSARISTRLIPGTSDSAAGLGGRMTFANVLANGTEARFCAMVGEIVRNATRGSADALKALRVLNASKKMAVPMMGKYMTEMLPSNADDQDQQVPSRIMLVMDYEVSMLYSMLDAFRQNMGEYSEGLGPLLKQGMHCDLTAAACPYSLGLAAPLLALAAATWRAL